MFERLKNWLSKPEKRCLTKADIKSLVGDVKNSEQAKDHIKKYLEVMDELILDIYKIDMGRWKCFVFNRYRQDGALIVYKRNWLNNYRKIFKRPETESMQGTGLSLLLLKFCIQNDIADIFIARDSGKIYGIGAGEVMQFATLNNTLLENEGEWEAHVPVSMLKPILFYK